MKTFVIQLCARLLVADKAEDMVFPTYLLRTYLLLLPVSITFNTTTHRIPLPLDGVCWCSPCYCPHTL